MQNNIRLNKRLVELGLAESRRKADELISAHVVTINGQPSAALGQLVTPDDSIKVRGKSGTQKSDITILFHKPTGYISSHSRQGNTPTIFELLPKNFAHLKIVGRLDKDSEGLLILSSSGSLVQMLSHPSGQKEKEYIVQIDKKIDSELLTVLKKPITIEGKSASFYKISRIDQNHLKIVLQEGRNRQIRRMLEVHNIGVIKLQRTRIDSYALGSIRPGKFEFIHIEADR